MVGRKEINRLAGFTVFSQRGAGGEVGGSQAIPEYQPLHLTIILLDLYLQGPHNSHLFPFPHPFGVLDTEGISVRLWEGLLYSSIEKHVEQVYILPRRPWCGSTCCFLPMNLD